MQFLQPICGRRFARLAASIALMAVSVTLCGCGAYYTMEGALGSKKIIVHDGDKKITVDIGTDIGGGLQTHPEAVDIEKKTFRLESPEGVVVEGTVIGPKVGVTEVTYKDKKLMQY